jgi:hypothetical protein
MRVRFPVTLFVGILTVLFVPQQVNVDWVRGTDFSKFKATAGGFRRRLCRTRPGTHGSSATWMHDSLAKG